MRSPDRSVLKNYGLAVVFVLLASLLGALASRPGTGATPYLFFSAAIVLTAFFAGLRPALTATLLSGLALSFFFLDPLFSFHIEDPKQIVRLMLFLAEGALLSICTTAASFMTRTPLQSLASRYGLAVAVVALATLAKLQPYGWLEGISSFRMFFLFPLAVVLASWSGGLGPGLLATVLACLAADLLFLKPYYSLKIADPDELLRLVLFAGEGVLISMVTGTSYTFRQRLRDQGLQLLVQQRLLLQSEQRYQLLVEGLRDHAVFLVDPAGKVANWSHAAEQIFGVGAEQAVGQDLASLLLFAEPREQEPGAAKHGPANGTGWLLRRDGGKAWVECTIAPLHDEHGNPLGSSVVVRDLSERKRSEEALRAAREKMEQAQRLEALAQLAGGVAHDFNNILTVISGNCYLLLATLPSDSPAREMAQQISDASDRAAWLTRQLLAFSRKDLLAPVVLNVNAVVSELFKMLQRLIGEDIQLVKDLADSLWPVKADPGLLTQVVLNLAVNARDAMPRGGRLRLATANVAAGEGPDGDHVCLTVSDTGDGMTEEVKAHLFEPFFTTKEPGRGTGLGLATVRSAVERCGGHIRMESALGKGTTFRVYLPRCERPQTEAQKQPPIASRPHRKATILLVEDDPFLLGTVGDTLRSAGYHVVEAPRPDRAMQVLQESAAAIDLLLTDVMMPGMSGPELAQATAHLRPGLPVLYLSGYPSEELRRLGMSAESVAFLQKPFRPDALLAQIRAVLDPSSPPAPPSPPEERA
jgi:PAS domain S-box-containing protein